MSLCAAPWLVPTLPTCFAIYQHRASNPLCEGLIQAQHNVAKRGGGEEGWESGREGGETVPKNENQTFYLSPAGSPGTPSP